jgi:hypothetical protein
MNPLLHLLQRGHACEAMFVSLVCKAQDMHKAGDHGLSGSARCNKCRSGFIRDAPRGRRSVVKALKKLRLV